LTVSRKSFTVPETVRTGAPGSPSSSAMSHEMPRARGPRTPRTIANAEAKRLLDDACLAVLPYGDVLPLGAIAERVWAWLGTTGERVAVRSVAAALKRLTERGALVCEWQRTAAHPMKHYRRAVEARE
jgi:hypothetical protein